MFKKPGKRQIRKRAESSDSGDESDKEEEVVSSVVGSTKEIQNSRKRQHGIDLESLSAGKVLKKERKQKDDPMKIETGGYVDMKALRYKAMSGETPLKDEEEDEQIGTMFAAETNRRDEDADMLKFVENEMNKKKGINKQVSEEYKKSNNPEDALYQLPDHLKETTTKKRTEDMLSNQMLSGIPEVDLGIDAKIRNIEATEEAKAKLLEERRNRRNRQDPTFVPTNMAVNYMQHNRFNIEDSAPLSKKAEPAPKPVPLRVGDADRPPTDMPNTSKDPSGQKGEKATDDFHYEKFKKYIRRY